jgi:hypothetical protein
VSTPEGLDGISDAELQLEYRALQEFLHLAPVGLVRCRRSGLITMMNPMAAQLLAPLGFGDGEPNLFDILDKASSDIRALVQTFRRTNDLILCDNYHIMLPEPNTSASAPVALGITVMQLQADPDGLMVVITDASSAVKLRRLQASWMR